MMAYVIVTNTMYIFIFSAPDDYTATASLLFRPLL